MTLLDPFFETRDPDGRLSLPALLARLSISDVGSFEHLRSFQRQPWHCFLTQLAGLAVSRTSLDGLTGDPDRWRSALLELAGPPAWSLVTEDLSEPAFLQSPVPEESLDAARYRNDTPTPDDFDRPISSTAHLVKPHQIKNPAPDHWAYALISLQTMQGYQGRGNYGIARMNAGFGSRSFLTLRPDHTWGAAFRRDARMLLRQRETDLSPFDKSDGHALLWILPWGGAKDEALPLQSLDPHFIEICRRLRMTGARSDLTLWRATTKGQRVDVPSSANGRLSDPWTPVNTEESKTLTVGSQGFNYRLLADILFSDRYRLPPSLTVDESDLDAGDLVLEARVLVRGQGKTDGLRTRLIPVPDASLLSEGHLSRLSSRAQMLLERVSEVQSSALYPAIGTLVGGGDLSDADSTRLNRLLRPYDRAVNDAYFDLLFSAPSEEASCRAYWDERLLDFAEESFSRAVDQARTASSKRWRLRSQAESIFYSRVRSILDRAPSFSQPSSSQPTTDDE